MSDLQEKLEKLTQTILKKKEDKKSIDNAIKGVGNLSVQVDIKQLFDTVYKVVSNISKTISDSILDKIDSFSKENNKHLTDKFSESLENQSKTQEEKSTQIIEKLEKISAKEMVVNVPDKVTISNIKDIVIPKNINVSNLKDIIIPKNEFPKDVAKKILSMVDMLQMTPRLTTFNRLNDGSINSILEQYDDFNILTKFNRDRSGDIKYIETEITR